MRRRRRLPYLLLLLTTGGCMPHVMHGPRVEGGTSGGFTASAGRQVGTGGYAGPFVPSLYAGLRHGFVAANDRSALWIGAQVPVPLFLYLADNDTEDDAEVALAVSYADVYVQPRGLRGGSYEAGVGALFSKAVLAPYFQVGEQDAEGKGWFVTPMLVLTRDEFDVGTYAIQSVAWRERGRADTAYQLGASFALPLQADSEGFLFSLTFTAELGLERSR